MLLKNKFMDRLNASEAKIEAFLATVSADTVLHLDSGWTVKDVIAHMTAWNWQMLLSCTAALNGSVYRITPFIHELQNWQSYRAALAQPWQAVHAEWLASHASARTFTEQLTDQQWAMPVEAPWGATTSMDALIDAIAGQLEDHWPQLQRAHK